MNQWITKYISEGNIGKAESKFIGLKPEMYRSSETPLKMHETRLLDKPAEL